MRLHFDLVSLPLKKNDLARQTIAAAECKGPETPFNNQIQNLVWSNRKVFPFLEKGIKVSFVGTNVDGAGLCCLLPTQGAIFLFFTLGIIHPFPVSFLISFSYSFPPKPAVGGCHLACPESAAAWNAGRLHVLRMQTLDYLVLGSVDADGKAFMSSELQ